MLAKMYNVTHKLFNFSEQVLKYNTKTFTQNINIENQMKKGSIKLTIS